jgi:serine/threonine protein kinase
MASECKTATLDATLLASDSLIPSTPRIDPHVGSVLSGQYRIDELLGRGGMGTVYRGVQLSVDRPVAIKVIAGEVERNIEHVQRFRREAEAMAKLCHPNTVRLLDFGVTVQGRLFMVMELLTGINLEQQLAQSGPFELPVALRIVREIAQSISEAHALGIVHRDLKPSNVILCHIDGGENFVKVMDFGVAGFQRDESHSTLTVKGAVLGTAAYMSPEQAQGFGVDARADLYSLGIMLFEMLTGQTPFQAKSALSLMLAQVSETPPRLVDINPRMRGIANTQALLDRLLAKAPDERPASATEVIDAVDHMLVELNASGRGSTQLPAIGAVRKERRPRRSATLGFGLFALVCASFLVLPSQRLDPFRAHARLSLGALQTQALETTSWFRAELQHLRPEPTTSITIASVPSGASVKLDGAELGKTPYALQLKQKRVIQLELEGHEAQTVSVDPAGDPNVVVQLVPMPPYRSAGQ